MVATIHPVAVDEALHNAEASSYSNHENSTGDNSHTES